MDHHILIIEATIPSWCPFELTMITRPAQSVIQTIHGPLVWTPNPESTQYIPVCGPVEKTPPESIARTHGKALRNNARLNGPYRRLVHHSQTTCPQTEVVGYEASGGAATLGALRILPVVQKCMTHTQRAQASKSSHPVAPEASCSKASGLKDLQ